jgi:hypothetical protein
MTRPSLDSRRTDLRQSTMASLAPTRTEQPIAVKSREERPLLQSRETGEIIPLTAVGGPDARNNKTSPVAKSWAHFVAGG